MSHVVPYIFQQSGIIAFTATAGVRVQMDVNTLPGNGQRSPGSEPGEVIKQEYDQKEIVTV